MKAPVKRRRKTKVMRDELAEMDYLHKLSPDQRAFLIQFMFEYYQGDFSFEKPIHPKEYIKDCRDRNNSSKRQLHSVGGNKLLEAIEKARKAPPWMANMYYTPDDYIKCSNEEICGEDDEKEPD